ncbi:MAG: 1,4-dihydroxy-2-naphthoate polyprenyltransferase [Anaerolineales bacterium]|nr:1,4-dihydroxy-2-naphthoate polyprenyltransferase [Anaerolineales bacterium]
MECIKVWIMAARPKTLPAAAAVTIVGSGAALGEGVFRLGPALAALFIALLLQIGANLANDVYDFYRGADQGGRLGPTRVTQAGLLTPRQVLAGMWLVFGLSALLGLYLAWQAGWVVLILGLVAIISAIAYTGGPYPLGYHGLGDVFVFIFFGLAAVCGTYYVQARAVSALACWAAVSMGLLTVNILVVNNLRDIESDRKIGKRTLAVRWGAGGARLQYAICLALAYALPLLMASLKVASPWVLLTWLTLPQGVRLARFLHQQQGRALNKALAGSGQLELFFGMLFAIGIAL